jgi:hypothetical protein
MGIKLLQNACSEDLYAIEKPLPLVFKEYFSGAETIKIRILVDESINPFFHF